MPDCRHFADDLKAYADRELSWPRRRAVARHLAGCASCRAEVHAMTQIADRLQSEEGAETPLDSSLRERILANAPAPASPARRPFQISPKAGLAFGAASLVAAGMVFQYFTPARESARQISVASEVKQMDLATRQYQMEHHERFPVASPPLMAADGNGHLKGGVVRFQDASGASVHVLPAGLANALGAQTADVAPLRQVHKEAQIGVQVDDPESKSDAVEQRVKSVGGYVAQNNLTTGGDGLKTAELTVKVPVEQFETVLGEVAKLGVVQAKNVTGEDITEKTSDAKQAESVMEDEVQKAEAHVAKLGKRAKWQDVQDARDARIELAQSRARLELLKKMARLSTLEVTLTQTPKAAPPVQSGFLGGLTGTGHDASAALLASVQTLLSLVIWIAAFSPLWLPVALAIRHYRRKTTVTP